MSEISKGQAIVETVAGFSLAGMPWWLQVFSEIGQLATAIAAICGAIIGVVGVATLIRRQLK